MKKFLIAAAGLAALGASSASAADLAARPYTKAPPPMVAPVLTWNGFYLGIQGGGAWGRSKETFFGAPNAPGFLGTQDYDTDGGFAGGVVGYNWQVGNTVFGLEGDYHWSDINGRSAEVNAGLLDTYNTKLRSFGDIKGRLGYAAGPALWFVSGGAAFTPQEANAMFQSMTVDPYWIVNARLALEELDLGRTKATVALWGRNIFNNGSPQFGFSLGTHVVAIYEAARTFGVDLKLDF